MSSNLRQYLGRYVPISVWLPAYAREFLRSDLISGVTVWGVMVPVATTQPQPLGQVTRHSHHARHDEVISHGT
jgi:hypothetical protein